MVCFEYVSFVQLSRLFATLLQCTADILPGLCSKREKSCIRSMGNEGYHGYASYTLLGSAVRYSRCVESLIILKGPLLLR